MSIFDTISVETIFRPASQSPLANVVVSLAPIVQPQSAFKASSPNDADQHVSDEYDIESDSSCPSLAATDSKAEILDRVM